MITNYVRTICPLTCLTCFDETMLIRRLLSPSQCLLRRLCGSASKSLRFSTDSSSSNLTVEGGVDLLMRRRGFVFPNSGIYGGLAGLMDYGPLGIYDIEKSVVVSDVLYM